MKSLLSLAKLDFNLLQEQHQKELGNITRWWKDLDAERKFPFARDRLVELYFWMSGVYFEPEYKATREILTKVMVIVTIFDDVYDVYATMEELELSTEAIERWDVNAKDGLPEYMQVCYETLLDLYDEIGYEVTRKGQSYRLFYAKEVVSNSSVTEQEAKEALHKQVVDGWKDMNEELRHPTVVPEFLQVRILNFARVFNVVYNDGTDHFSLAGTKFKELVTSLLVDPLPMLWFGLDIFESALCTT
ncbi:hypothetical protein NL676_038458 [Syzygium grande]|nr:hypothetical protein NL676_038458 [Syzygium grande]